MTANILTVGHIQCIKYLSGKGKVIISLLTKKGLKGYKDELVPFKDRKYILENFGKVVPQNNLDPSENIEKYKCTAIASGDGWEKAELEAIKRFKIKKINIPLPKKYSSSDIISKSIKIYL